MRSNGIFHPEGTIVILILGNLEGVDAKFSRSEVGVFGSTENIENFLYDERKRIAMEVIR